jgi:hypothetical protein
VAVGVKLYAPKFRPLIVTVPDPERSVFFGAAALNTGASNVNAFVAFVPTTAPTVTFEYEVVSVVAALSVHATVVADDHDVVPQSASKATFAVAVKPYEPKFSPVIVTIAPPDAAPFHTTS